MTKEQLLNVKAKDALKHPTWNMGAKVTIDSSTLMNKGLEIIEAKHLFNIAADKISVVIHKQSIIHSLVTYNDNSVIAELSYPDMRLPIQLAFTYPAKIDSKLPELDLAKVATLTFENPDIKTFPCLGIAIDCAKKGGFYPAVINAANEIAVEAFLKDKVGFYDIPRIIEKTLDKCDTSCDMSLDNVFEVDKQSRIIAGELLK